MKTPTEENQVSKKRKPENDPSNKEYDSANKRVKLESEINNDKEEKLKLFAIPEIAMQIIGHLELLDVIRLRSACRTLKNSVDLCVRSESKRFRRFYDSKFASYSWMSDEFAVATEWHNSDVRLDKHQLSSMEADLLKHAALFAIHDYVANIQSLRVFFFNSRSGRTAFTYTHWIGMNTGGGIVIPLDCFLDDSKVYILTQSYDRISVISFGYANIGNFDDANFERNTHRVFDGWKSRNFDIRDKRAVWKRNLSAESGKPGSPGVFIVWDESGAEKCSVYKLKEGLTFEKSGELPMKVAFAAKENLFMFNDSWILFNPEGGEIEAVNPETGATSWIVKVNELVLPLKHFPEKLLYYKSKDEMHLLDVRDGKSRKIPNYEKFVYFENVGDNVLLVENPEDKSQSLFMTQSDSLEFREFGRLPLRGGVKVRKCFIRRNLALVVWNRDVDKQDVAIFVFDIERRDNKLNPVREIRLPKTIGWILTVDDDGFIGTCAEKHGKGLIKAKLCKKISN